MTPDNDATKLSEHIHHYPGTGRYEIVPEDGEPWSVWIDPRYVASDDLRAIAAHMDAQAGRTEAVGVTEALTKLRGFLRSPGGYPSNSPREHEIWAILREADAALAQPTATDVDPAAWVRMAKAAGATPVEFQPEPTGADAVEVAARALFDQSTRGSTFSEEHTVEQAFQSRRTFYRSLAEAALRAIGWGPHDR